MLFLVLVLVFNKYVNVWYSMVKYFNVNFDYNELFLLFINVTTYEDDVEYLLLKISFVRFEFTFELLLNILLIIIIKKLNNVCQY